jgi:hypothetical protein
VTREPQLAAEVTVAGEAQSATAARDGRVDDDMLAGARAAFDDARELVAEDERPLEVRVADTALEEPVPIGAAKADPSNPHEHLPGTRLRIRLLVHAELAGPMQPKRLHAGWP